MGTCSAPAYVFVGYYKRFDTETQDGKEMYNTPIFLHTNENGFAITIERSNQFGGIY